MTDSFIQKIKWFVLLWMGNSVSLFTRNKVIAEDAVFQIQNKFVEGVFHWKPPVCNLCINYIRGGENYRACNCFPGYRRTFDFFFFSLQHNSEGSDTPGSQDWVFFLGKKDIFWGRKRCVKVWGRQRRFLPLNHSAYEAQGISSLWSSGTFLHTKISV